MAIHYWQYYDLEKCKKMHVQVMRLLVVGLWLLIRNFRASISVLAGIAKLLLKLLKYVNNDLFNFYASLSVIFVIFLS